MALAVASTAVGQVFQLIDPLILRRILDDFIMRADEYSAGAFLRGVATWLLAAVLVATGARLTRALQVYVVRTTAHRVGADLYSDGLRHALARPFVLLVDQRSGEVFGKLQRVRQDVEKLMTTAIDNLFGAGVAVVFVTVYAVTVHWTIVPALVLTAPILIVFSSVLSRRVKDAQREIVAATTKLAGSTTESLRNVELVKSLGVAEQEFERLDAVTEELLHLELDKVRTIRLCSFLQSMCVVTLRAAVMFLLLYLVFTGQVSVGQWLSFLLYASYVFGPLQDLGPAVATYREAEASLASFNSLLQEPIDPQPVASSRIGQLDHVAFRGVGFAYDNVQALSDVSFEAGIGETVAFVGPSGAGKTTLVRLLVGLYSPTRGVTEYNGRPVDSVDLGELRSQIGLVAQDPQLFAGSIRDNLLFAAPNATDASCLEALRLAACGNLLQRGRHGLDALIGEGGIRLSGGERQRLAIARAVLRQPRLMIFDEATSALDSITEREVSEAIRDSSTAGRITILVAHRLSTVRHADVIHVLERGRITESGAHEALLSRKGLYYAMWRQQVGEGRQHPRVRPTVSPPTLAPAT